MLTVWAGAAELEATVAFYESVLELSRVDTGSNPYVFEAGGSSVAIMRGRLPQPIDPAQRWPLFALSVTDLDKTMERLSQADVKLPWGVEKFGEPVPTSRYVMFYDPAGNLIELVEWL